MHYLLHYEKSPNHALREPPHQAAHLAHVRAAVTRGDLLLGGPLLDPTDGSNLLLFTAESHATVESFATADPYVQHGIVTRYQIRPWQTVVGPTATCPLPE
jgi:hypothetical protein